MSGAQGVLDSLFCCPCAELPEARSEAALPLCLCSPAWAYQALFLFAVALCCVHTAQRASGLCWELCLLGAVFVLQCLKLRGQLCFQFCCSFM